MRASTTFSSMHRLGLGSRYMRPEDLHFAPNSITLQSCISSKLSDLHEHEVCVHSIHSDTWLARTVDVAAWNCDGTVPNIVNPNAANHGSITSDPTNAYPVDFKLCCKPWRNVHGHSAEHAHWRNDSGHIDWKTSSVVSCEGVFCRFQTVSYTPRKA